MTNIFFTAENQLNLSFVPFTEFTECLPILILTPYFSTFLSFSTISHFLNSSPLCIYSPISSSLVVPSAVCSSSIFLSPSPHTEISITVRPVMLKRQPAAELHKSNTPPCQIEKENSALASKWKNSFPYCSGCRGQLWSAINFTHT